MPQEPGSNPPVVDSETITSTPTSAKVTGPTNVFSSQSFFLNYLTDHPKCKEAMQQLNCGIYSIQGRRAVTQVAVSKLIDTYDHYLDTKLKQKVAGWLADLTGIKATDYFDPSTHKGFLSKHIENRRRHLPPTEKRWVWSKKTKCDSSHGESTAATLLEVSDQAERMDGCPRNVSECSYCEGSWCGVFFIFVSSACIMLKFLCKLHCIGNRTLQVSN
jgi:hypothetical protein